MYLWSLSQEHLFLQGVHEALPFLNIIFKIWLPKKSGHLVQLSLMRGELRGKRGQTETHGCDLLHWLCLSKMKHFHFLRCPGLHTATLSGSTCVTPWPRGVSNPLNPTHDTEMGLQLFSPVIAGHKLALIKYLLFVHTTRHSYQSDGLVNPQISCTGFRSRPCQHTEYSCNKVSVGEPVERSLLVQVAPLVLRLQWCRVESRYHLARMQRRITVNLHFDNKTHLCHLKKYASSSILKLISC